MKVINNRYEVLELLESDIYGNVYHVADLNNEGVSLRLKLLSLELSDTKVVEYFKRNFINLVSIGHKNLLIAHEFEIVTSIDSVKSVKKQYFYTSEYYASENLVQLKYLNKEEKIEVVKQVCYALEYLHFRGVVYKFLSPENLIVTRIEEGILVRLNDVASMHEYASQMNSKDDYIKQFFAPEIMRNEEGTTESDIYSLGILIFYLLHDLDPKQENFREVFNDTSDKEVDRLISVMTFNNPHERYETIQEFVLEFQKIYLFDYPFWDKLYYEKLNFTIPLIGHERLKSRCVDLFNNKLQGENDVRMILIDGECGSGKSRFLDELLFLNRIENVKISNVQLGLKHTNGFFAVKKVLRDIIRQYNINPEIINKYGPELVKVLPEMANRWKVKPSKALSEEKHEVLRLTNRIYRFIIEFTNQSPLIVLIDNFHCVSEQELELFNFLMSSKANIPLVFICSYREELFNDASLIQEWVKKDKAEKQIIRKFNYSEACDMIAAILGIGEKPMELTTKIMTEAMGNPKHIEEIVKNLYMFERLAVNDDRKWEMSSDYIKDLEIPFRVDDIVNFSIEDLDERMITVLQVMSVFEAPVSFYVLKQMIDMSDEILEQKLNDLVDYKLLNRKLGDWGYRYDFYNKRLCKTILNDVAPELRLNYHRKASEVLEEQYRSDARIQSEDLVYDLIKCDRLEDAAKYAVEADEKMGQLNIHKQAMEFYTKALDLLKQLNKEDQIARLMIQLARIQLKMNESDGAIETLESALSIAKVNGDKRVLIDIWNMRSEISLLKKDLVGVKDYATRTLNTAKEIGYVEGELNASLILCRLNLADGDLDSIKEITSTYLNYTRTKKLPYYYGRFLNELGIYYIQKNMISDAFKSFIESCNYLEKSDNEYDITRPLNNLGILSFDSLGDVLKSREYYGKAIEITDKMNITWGKDMLYSNMSETYLKEDRYDKALIYLSDAIRIAEASGTHDVLFYIYSNLCVANYEMCRYDEAYRYLIKLEYEYRGRIGKTLYEGFYHLNHIAYFISVKDYEKAYDWYDRIQKLKMQLPENIEFSLKLNKIRLDIFTGNMHELHQAKLFENLEVLVTASTNPVEIKEVRDLILDIAFEYLQAGENSEVNRLLVIDESLIEIFNTDRLAVKRAVLSGILEENKIDYFEELIQSIKDRPYDIEKWVSYFLLGNAYLEENSFYLAMIQYSNGLEILRRITYLIPEDQRLAFIINDDFKITLYNRINELIDKVLSRKPQHGMSHREFRPLSIDDFFDLKDVSRLYRNKKFLKSVRKAYTEKHGLKLESTDELMGALGTTEYSNIKLIVEYLAQECFADVGAIYLFDEYHGIKETISAFNSNEVIDISRYLNMLDSDNKGIYIKANGKHKTLYSTEEKAKAVILIPIVSHTYLKQNKSDLKRKYDVEMVRAKTIGYLFLASEKVFNNFTEESFETCRSFVNLLYVMLDNYELKKMSSVDKLTGVYLRKHIEDLFTEELNQAKDKHHELSVVMADIDHFKNVNDIYGHQRGDEILTSIGSIFKEYLRDEDLVGRYGGEEFILVLPKTGEIDAFNVCEKIRKVIESSNLLGKESTLSMSFGISSFPPHGIIEHELIEKADQALYESKHMGRNRSTIWTPYIGDAMLRFDKLAGILVGNISADTRKVQSIVDIMSMINRPIAREAKIYETINQLIDICEADTATVLSYDGEEVYESFTREVGQEQMKYHKHVPDHIVEHSLTTDFGEVFIDWSAPYYDQESKTPDWLSYIVMPLVYEAERKGLVVMSVSVSKKEFDFDVFNYVNTLNGVISVIMYGDKR